MTEKQLKQKARELGEQPAFPSQCWEGGIGTEFYPDQFSPGLTKREYFAGLAMQGLVEKVNQMNDSCYAYNSAQVAIVCADALLLELVKEQQGESACLPEKVYDNPLDDPSVPF